MRLSLNWLKDYVDVDMSPTDLAHLMTMSGLEVEGIEAIGQSLQGIVVARIMSVKQHPEADRLFICNMDTGKGEVPVVCSATNLHEGALVPMAMPDTSLPNGIVVKESRIRGEHSAGMLLAEDEMGLSDDHTGIMILPDNLEQGTQISSAMPLEDYTYEISLTPNRPDCASVIGIAREIAALTGQKLRMPEIKLEEGDTLIEDITNITIDDPEGCPRYAAGIIQGIELKPSPFWMRYRLYASGIRSINNVVDITNYVLMEMGQPLHAFDYHRLKENRIVIRRAADGEKFTTLDGQTHTLDNENLMICDGERSVALAGIMGGLNSEIFAGSKDVLLESAYFDPVTIRRGSKRLGLSTEASYRFERGIDIEGVTRAARRALMLLSDLAGGKIAKGLIDNYPKPYDPPVIDLRIKKTNDYLGTSLSKETIASYLKGLEMEVSDLDEDVIQVRPPTFRVDITREVDLTEEVARLEGYDKIPVTSPFIRPSEEGDSPGLLIRDQVSEIMAGLGFSEIITYSFISPDSADILGAESESPLRSFVNLQNPLTIDQSVMRTSLIPGLLSVVKNNITHGETDLKLFEWGKIFLHSDAGELPDEKVFLAAIMTGLYKRKEWYNKDRDTDFYDIKGTVEVLLKGLGLREIELKRDKVLPGYHPEVSCGIYISDSHIGNVGQVSPDVMEGYDVKAESAYLFDLDIEALLEKIQEESVRFEPFAKFPAVFRDISLITDRKTESIRIRDIVESEGADLVESVNLFDLYEGEKMDHSKKALSFRICYRSKEGTLDGKVVNQLHETIINRIMEETGAILREG
ncbi:MAG: phenylalanine--tRNA ligase subunit beta [Deltaproteobacteria bacterium]|nr:phenylalanine--tRNA ligase subunit beta [Deltaproteobacteria bacterium]